MNESFEKPIFLKHFLWTILVIEKKIFLVGGDDLDGWIYVDV